MSINTKKHLTKRFMAGSAIFASALPTGARSKSSVFVLFFISFIPPFFRQFPCFFTGSDLARQSHSALCYTISHGDEYA